MNTTKQLEKVVASILNDFTIYLANDSVSSLEILQEKVNSFMKETMTITTKAKTTSSEACGVRTTKGGECKKKRVAGKETCSIHDKEKVASISTCKVLLKSGANVGKPCGKNCKSGNDKCTSHTNKEVVAASEVITSEPSSEVEESGELDM